MSINRNLFLLQELGGTLEETAAAIDAAGGKGIPVACDHADDAQARDIHTLPLCGTAPCAHPEGCAVGSTSLVFFFASVRAGELRIVMIVCS